MDYGQFDGDGRETVCSPDGRVYVRKREARRMIDRFMVVGTHFSASGATAWIIRDYCRRQNIPIREQTSPGFPGVRLVKV